MSLPHSVTEEAIEMLRPLTKKYPNMSIAVIMWDPKDGSTHFTTNNCLVCACNGLTNLIEETNMQHAEAKEDKTVN